MRFATALPALLACGLPLLASPPASSAQTLALPSPDGRRSLTAERTTVAPVIDGRLDEAMWQGGTPASGFIQSDPVQGQPATEDTEVRVAFDDEFLYIGAFCRDSDPAGIVVNEIRKDATGKEQDSFEVLLDTFADRRNGFVFGTNAAGARADTQMANEGREINSNWDAVWWVASQRTPEGWTTELKIPFKTLRFEGGADHVWGINFSRRIRRKNELSYWSPVSRAFTIHRASSEGDLRGLPALQQGRNIRVKPYLLGGAVRPVGGASFSGDRGIGLDVKAGVTTGMTLDVTVNPDFAQAEADEQQVNLTQFSLFYPEKREFFLENSGIFYFGDIPRNSRAQSRFRPPEEDLLLFFSRRIGLDGNGVPQPLHGGLRLTGRAGKYGIGMMTMQSEGRDGRPGTNYAVTRVRRDLFRSSDIGAIVLNRQSGTSDDFNRVVGLDGNFRFPKNVNLNGFIARSETPGETRNQTTAKLSLGFENSSIRTQYAWMMIGEGFRDDIGFVRRVGVTRHVVDLAWLPQPAALRKRGIRQLQPHTRAFLYYDPSGRLVTKQWHAGFQVMLNSGTYGEYAVEPRTEAITRNFTIAPGVVIPAGRYDWLQKLIVLETDHSRALSASIRYTFGEFWSGTQRNLQTSILYRPTYRLFFDAGVQVTDVTLQVPNRSFLTKLVNVRTGYAFNTNMFLDALLQYRNDLHQFSANVRFNLIHRPLSDLFIVYNDQRFTDQPLVNPGHGLVLKYTQMLSF